MLEINLASYLAQIRYEPDFLKRLNMVFLQIWKIKKDLDLAEYLSNMDIKFGLLKLGKYFIEQNITKQTSTHYHFSTFIYNTKAFLDSIANVLNLIHNLQFKGAEIDLTKTEFSSRLYEKNSVIATEILNKMEWIKKVSYWRTETIHRKSPIFPYIQNKEPKAGDPMRMPKEPVSWIRLGDYMRKMKSKNIEAEQDINPFCDSWLDNSEELFAITSNHVINEFQN